MKTKFNIGDKVAFLNETGGGVIVKNIDKQSVMIDSGDGLEFPYLIKNLILISKSETIIQDEPEQIEPEPFIEPESPIDLTALRTFDFSKQNSRKKKSTDITNYAHSLTEKIVDLHIEKLTNNFAEMSNAEKLHLQIGHFESIMDEAISGKYRKLILVHGVGNGILKKEILLRLKNFQGIQVKDADIYRFGFGATEVNLL